MNMARHKVAHRPKYHWLILLTFAGLLIAACSTGSYPVDVFTEMHYQQSFKSQEPPRLTPARGAVVFTDELLPLRRLEPASQVEALGMTNPVPRTAETVEQGEGVFIRNCSACHGLNGRGDSFIAVTFKSMGVNPPADFATAGSIVATPDDGSGDGLAFWFISDGITNMPSFRNLLTQEERWTVIHYLRVLSQQANR